MSWTTVLILMTGLVLAYAIALLLLARSGRLKAERSRLPPKEANS